MLALSGLLLQQNVGNSSGRNPLAISLSILGLLIDCSSS